jgi:hypothetical protein
MPKPHLLDIIMVLHMTFKPIPHTLNLITMLLLIPC